MSDAPPHPGQRISYAGAPCTVRYVGPVAGTTGSWLGVEWDDGTRGRHDGSHGGVRYFTCLSRSPTAASFVRPTRPRDHPQGFLAAVREKYLGGDAAASAADHEHDRPQVRISGTKVAEEVGFDKVRSRLAQVGELRTVIVDGLRVAFAVAGTDAEESIAGSCPNVTHLDLSRNLFEGIGPVVEICEGMRGLRKLSIDGNRFHHLLTDPSLDRIPSALANVAELSLQETLLTWEELCAVAARCPRLATLDAGSNQLAGSLPRADYGPFLPSTLTTLRLEFNEFTTLEDLSGLAALTSLRNLHLKGNNVAAATAAEPSPVIFPPSLHYLDLSYNKVASWSFVDALPVHLPGLTGLRLSHNPVYETGDDDDGDVSNKASAGTWSSEESHMIAIARLAPLQNLNFAPVKPADRANAEMFYLSRIARQLAAVPASAEGNVLARHPRHVELCRIYGAPEVVRRKETNPSFLEARLVTVAFHMAGEAGGGQGTSRRIRIPKSFDVYAVRGIAGKLFGLSPLRVRLVWETGEWDPVGGYEDGEGESGDEELLGKEMQQEDDGRQRQGGGSDAEGGGGGAVGEPDADQGGGGRPGRWVRREVVLRHGPKQLGYCVDGMDVRVRVEGV